MTGSNAHPTVLAIHLRDDGFMDGCNQYRFRIPFEELRRRVQGGIFDWAPLGKVREWAGMDRSQVPSRVKPTDYDMFLLPRFRPTPYQEGEFENMDPVIRSAVEQLGIQLTGKSHMIDLMRVLRGTVMTVLEYDDDYFTNSRDLGYDLYELFYDFLKEVDAFTVSTDYLRKLVQRHAPGKPVFILPNCVDWDEWQDHHRWEMIPDDHVVLGLTGSSTHYEDWKVLETVLPRILKEHGNVIYLSGAYLPDYLEPLQDQYPDRVIAWPAVEYEEYPAVVRQADIVLCPVVPTDPFNFGKSALKAVEGLAASRVLPNGQLGGGVPVTSPLFYYQRVTGGGKRGLTVPHTPEGWYDGITTLIKNQDMRMRLAQKGRGWVRKHRAIDQQWHLWWAAYQEIYRRKRR